MRRGIGLRTALARAGGGVIAAVLLTAAAVLICYRLQHVVVYVVAVTLFALVLAVGTVRVWRSEGPGWRGWIAALVVAVLAAGLLIGVPRLRLRGVLDESVLWTATGGAGDSVHVVGDLLYIGTGDIITVVDRTGGRYLGSYRPDPVVGEARTARIQLGTNGWLLFQRPGDDHILVTAPGFGPVMRLRGSKVVALGNDTVVVRTCAAATSSCAFRGWRRGSDPDHPVPVWQRSGYVSPIEYDPADGPRFPGDERRLPESAYWAKESSFTTTARTTVVVDARTGEPYQAIPADRPLDGFVGSGGIVATTDATCHVTLYRDGRRLWQRGFLVSDESCQRSGVTVIGSTVYVGRAGTHYLGTNATTAFDLTAARPVDVGPTELFDEPSGYTNSYATLPGDGIAVRRAEHGRLTAIDTRTGGQVWQHTLDTKYPPAGGAGNGAVVTIGSDVPRSPFVDRATWEDRTDVSVFDTASGRRCAHELASYDSGDDRAVQYHRYPVGPGQVLISDGFGHLTLVGCPTGRRGG